MVKANIAGEPLQDFWKFVEGTAIHAGFEEFPILMAFPISRVKIVLNIEQPYASTTSHEQKRQFNQNLGLPASVKNRPADNSEQSHIRPHHTIAFALARFRSPETMRENKDDRRAYCE